MKKDSERLQFYSHYLSKMKRFPKNHRPRCAGPVSCLPSYHSTVTLPVCGRGGHTLELQIIILQLKRERDRLDRAIAALERGAKPSAGRTRRRRRKMTPEGRRRLSQMMKKRWADRRKKIRAK